jgi:Caspase domain
MSSDEAREPPTTGAAFSRRKLVVVVGIDEYKALPTLRCAVSDAIGVQDLLVKQFGFEAPIPPLTNAAATKPAIEALIEDALRTLLRPEDVLVLFFAGHGTTRLTELDDVTVETGYLAPVDAQGLGMFGDLLCMEELLRKVAVLPARHIVVVLDACHSGMALGNAVTRHRSVSSFVHRLAGHRSRRVITSARRDEQAQDSGPIPGHSLFTGMLIEALTSGRADLDRNGIVTFSELALFLQQQVGQASGARQTPDHGAFQLDDRGELMLTVPTGAGIRADVWDPAPAHSLGDMPLMSGRRGLGIARAAIMGGAITIGVAIAIGVAMSASPRSMPLDTDGVKLLARRTTLDLREWKETSDDDIMRKRKQSKAVSVNEFTIERLHAGGKTFFHRIGTSSPIDPEITGTNCQLQVIHKDISPAPREWNIVCDIQNEPIGQPISIRFRVTFWNAFQLSEQWWGGFRILHPTNLAAFRVVFPSSHRPVPSDISFAFKNAGSARNEVVVPEPGKSRIVVGHDGRVDEVEWTVDHPDDDRSYRVYWNWPELLTPPGRRS